MREAATVAREMLSERHMAGQQLDGETKPAIAWASYLSTRSSNEECGDPPAALPHKGDGEYGSYGERRISQIDPDEKDFRRQVHHAATHRRNGHSLWRVVVL